MNVIVNQINYGSIKEKNFTTNLYKNFTYARMVRQEWSFNLLEL